nr:cupin domain-containing protein [Altericroceibacterium indicum]
MPTAVIDEAASPKTLPNHPIHLGLDGNAVPLPAIDSERWYDEYLARFAGDGTQGRLISQFSFSENWESWEMHPHGDEIVLCIAGTMVLHQQSETGETATVTLKSGDYAINPAGWWHTADATTQVTAIFITTAYGTIHRAREAS